MPIAVRHSSDRSKDTDRRFDVGDPMQHNGSVVPDSFSSCRRMLELTLNRSTISKLRPSWGGSPECNRPHRPNIRRRVSRCQEDFSASRTVGAQAAGQPGRGRPGPAPGHTGSATRRTALASSAAPTVSAAPAVQVHVASLSPDRPATLTRSTHRTTTPLGAPGRRRQCSPDKTAQGMRTRAASIRASASGCGDP
jgi:hypothetical protein